MVFYLCCFSILLFGNIKSQLQRDKVPSSWSPVYVGLQRWRRRGSKIENQSSSSLHTCTGSYKAAAANTHTGSNALQSSNRRLRVARVGASVYVVVQRCCRIKPLQGAAGKAPGALPLSVPVGASLLLYYCCPPPPPCVSAPFDSVGATTPLVRANLCFSAPKEFFIHSF